jgi:mannonate dehydratase
MCTKGGHVEAPSPSSASLPPAIPAGTELALQMSAEPTPEELQFAQQLGVKYAVLWTDGAKAGYEFYASRREIFERAGIRIYGFGNWDVHTQDAIVLNLPGRDAKVEQYKQHLRALGRAGIPYTTYAHMANGIWSTETELTRGGAVARAFDLDKAESGHWFGQRYFMPLSHERPYSEDEIWENFRSFIEEVAPVAEEAGVRIGIHPDDPPGVDLAGVPRCIFGNFKGYQRALEIASSPNVGVCFCVGCWLEGGALMGNGVIESLRAFAEQGKLFKVHFRNVNAPLPHFVETFVDDGYMDMYPVMRELVANGFNGVAIADHIPMMGDDRRLGTAYTIGYMKALRQRAIEEVGIPV